MKDSKGGMSCLWAYRFEFLGLILIAIATILTLATLNSVGIAAMFIVGLILCAHKCICKTCHPNCSDDEHQVDESKGTDKKSSKS